MEIIAIQCQSFSLVSINPQLLALGHGGNVHRRTGMCTLSATVPPNLILSHRLALTRQPCLWGPDNLFLWFSPAP